MRRSITAAAAATALLLAGCGSTAGTASPGPTTASSSAAPSVTAASSSSADSTTSATSTAESTASSTADSSTEDSTTADTSSTDSTITDTSSTEDTTTSETSKTGVITSTISATDDDTLAWFGEFCGAVTPLANLPKISSATYKADVVKYLTAFGAALTAAGQRLSTLPPPGFDGGKQFSAKVITAFLAVAPKLTKAGADLEASSSTDKAAVTKALDSADKAFTDIGNQLGLDQYDFDKATKAAIAKVPACGPLFGTS